ncbi:MAG: carboxypeptidase regulatory-like domain-containing protein, partial [Dehalococcoidia bacterium]
PAITTGGELSYTLASETNGSTTVTVQLNDDGLTANGGVDASPAVTFTITVDPVFDVTGTITLQGATTAAEVTAIGATVTLTPSGGGPAFATVTVASDGTFSISDAPVGTYTIRAEADGYQAAERTNLAITTSDVAMPTIELKGGLADISDTTDTVDGADVSLVTSSFGTVTEDRTNGSPDNDVVDINGDGAVSAIDISIMVSNLGLTGTQAW